MASPFARNPLSFPWFLQGDFHAAQDIAQESFVTAYLQLKTLRNPGVFGPWVAQMTARLARKRAKEFHPLIPLDTDPQLSISKCGDWDHEDLQQVLAALARLPDSEREVMILRYIDDHDVTTIARLTDRPLGTVTKQISRALERLRQRMKEANR